MNNDTCPGLQIITGNHISATFPASFYNENSFAALPIPGHLFKNQTSHWL